MRAGEDKRAEAWRGKNNLCVSDGVVRREEAKEKNRAVFHGFIFDTFSSFLTFSEAVAGRLSSLRCRDVLYLFFLFFSTAQRRTCSILMAKTTTHLVRS